MSTNGDRPPTHAETRPPLVSRRDVVRVGCLTALGVSLRNIIAPSTLSAATPLAPRAKACILLWLDGGPSHLEMWDLKPDAPAEVRGPFAPIATRVPGLSLSELLPATAQLAHHLAVVRSLTSPLGEHGLANQYLLTGYKPSPALSYPSYGAVVAHQTNGRGALPPYVVVPEARFAGAGFLGARCEPFATGGDPARRDFRVADLDFYPEVDERRLTRRQEFLRELDAAQAEREGRSPPAEPAYDRAFRLATSPVAKQAFDLSGEPEATRQRYGSRMFGQSCLLARRLVERGVPFVTVNQSGWDTHDGLVLRLKLGYAGAQIGVGLGPTFDQGFAALLADLSDRGLLDSTLVVAMGEFGRTP